MIVCRRFPEGKTDIPTSVLVLGEAYDSSFLHVEYTEMIINPGLSAKASLGRTTKREASSSQSKLSKMVKRQSPK